MKSNMALHKKGKIILSRLQKVCKVYMIKNKNKEKESKDTSNYYKDQIT